MKSWNEKLEISKYKLKIKQRKYLKFLEKTIGNQKKEIYYLFKEKQELLRLKQKKQDLKQLVPCHKEIEQLHSQMQKNFKEFSELKERNVKSELNCVLNNILEDNSEKIKQIKCLVGQNKSAQEYFKVLNKISFSEQNDNEKLNLYLYKCKKYETEITHSVIAANFCINNLRQQGIHHEYVYANYYNNELYQLKQGLIEKQKEVEKDD